MRFRQRYTSYWLLHLRVLDPENEGTTHLQNTANSMLNKTGHMPADLNLQYTTVRNSNLPSYSFLS